MGDTLKRIKEYIDFKGITVSSFEKSVGISNGSFASQLKNNKTIGVDKLENILKTYKEINPEWVLTGIGNMIKAETGNTSTEIERLRSENAMLKELLKAKEELLENYRAQAVSSARKKAS